MSQMTEAATKFIAEAVGHFTASADPADIKKSTAALTSMLEQWKMLDKQVRQTIGTLLTTARQNCKHKGAQTGHNERDGSWMSPCPTCGYSY